MNYLKAGFIKEIFFERCLNFFLSQKDEPKLIKNF